MKNTMRCLGIIALVAVIGFSVIACDNGMASGPGGGTGTGGQTSAREGTGWPPSNVRNSYGISGMNQPPGSGFQWAIVNGDRSDDFSDALLIQWTGAGTTQSTISNWFSSNGWSGGIILGDMGAWQRGSRAAVYMGGSPVDLVIYNNYTGGSF